MSSSFDYESKTINLWFNVIEADSDLGIIYTSDNPALNYGLTVLSVKKIDSNLELYFNVSKQIDTVNIEEDTWYNASIVTDGMNYLFYLNGELINTNEFGSYFISSNGHEHEVIGSLRTLDQRFFNGLVDDLRIFERKLSNDEIINIYKE